MHFSSLSCAYSFLFYSLPPSLHSWQWQRLDKHTLSLSLFPSLSLHPPPLPSFLPLSLSLPSSLGPWGAFCLTRLDICFLKSIVCLKRTSLTICFRGLHTETHAHTQQTHMHFGLLEFQSQYLLSVWSSGLFKGPWEPMSVFSRGPSGCLAGGPRTWPRLPSSFLLPPSHCRFSVWLISKSVWHVDEAWRLSQETVCVCMCVCVHKYVLSEFFFKCTANPFSKLLAVALCLRGNSGTRGLDSDNLTSWWNTLTRVHLLTFRFSDAQTSKECF